MKTTTVPKAAKCDDTIAAILDMIVQRNADCIILTKYKINPTNIELTFDEDHCQTAP